MKSHAMAYRHLFAALALATASSTTLAGGEHAHGMLDNLRYGKILVDELEWRDGASEGALTWDAEAFYGSDLHRFGIETEGERSNGATEEASAEALYRRAIAPFWDLKLGWRHDFQPAPQRDWFALGIDGLVPYGVDAEAMLYVGESGHALLALKAGYELLLTQRLVLEPALELGLAGREDRETETGSGVNGVELSLRLRYEITRKFAPYVGVIWRRASGDSADLIETGGGDPEQSRIVAGIHFWL